MEDRLSKDKIRVSVALPKKLVAKYDRIADQRGVSRSMVIHESLKLGIELQKVQPFGFNQLAKEFIAEVKSQTKKSKAS